jgi:ketosteroid isomerase-like protein
MVDIDFSRDDFSVRPQEGSGGSARALLEWIWHMSIRSVCDRIEGRCGHRKGNVLMTALTDQVNAMEAQLREAMLAGDLKVLDALLAEDVVFTDQTGNRLTKADDMAAHRLGRLKITQINISDQRVRPCGTCAIVTLVADVGGSFDGQSFSGRFAYTRVWERPDGKWRVAAAHCSAVT